MKWELTVHKKMKVIKPIVIEGLPGIGNVGKVAADFLVEELKAEKMLSFFSYSLPHSVIVQENNLIELPSINIFYKKLKRQDYLFIVGDVQPIDEISCYSFCEELLNLLTKLRTKEIITLGGIGLSQIPKQPKVYCTANRKDIIERYKGGTKLNSNIYGLVGPIVGVSGVLLGLANKKKIPAITILAETLGHPMYLGIKGSKEIVAILNKKLELGINIKKLDKEIKDIDEEIMKRTEGFLNLGTVKKEDTNYIG